MLQTSGQIDVVIGSLYVLILGSIGALMLKDALVALGYIGAPRGRARRGTTAGSPRCPLRWRFYSSGLYISPVAPLALGFLAGILTVLLGIGGGFILVPAMIYLLGMPARVVIGTSLVMMLAVSAATTMVHALTTRAVDIVLAGLLLARRRHRRAIWRPADDADQARPAAAGARRDHPARRASAWRSASPGVPTKSTRSNICERSRSASIVLAGLAPLLIAADKPLLVPDISARQVADPLQLHRRAAVAVRRHRLSRRPAAEPPGRHRRCAAGPVQPILVREKQKIAGIWMNADSNRFRSAPSFYAVASSRPLATLVDERTAAIYELGLHNLQLSPGGGALPDKERRFEAGLLDLRQPHGLYSENPHGVEISERRALPRAHHHPEPGAGRHLYGRNLPDRPRPGPRGGDARHPDQQIGLRAVRGARRPAPPFLYGLTAVAPVAGAGLGRGRGVPAPLLNAAPKPILTASLTPMLSILRGASEPMDEQPNLQRIHQ